MKAMLRTALVAMMVACSLTGAASARADGGLEHMTWEELVRRATEAKDPQTALSWAKKAADIRMTTSLRAFTMQKQIEAQKFAEAYLNARVCIAETADDPKADKDIVEACKKAISDLQTRIGQLTVKLPSPLPSGAKVRIGGEDVSPGILALPYPANPGKVPIEVSAPGFVTFKTDANVAAGGETAVEVALKPEEITCSVGQVVGPDQRTCVALCTVGKVYTSGGAHCCWPGQAWSIEKSACSGAPMCPGDLVARGDDCIPKQQAIQAASSTASAPPPRSVKPLLVAGAGAAVGIAGTVVYLISSSKYSSLKDQCDSTNGCTQSEKDSQGSSIKTLDTLAATGWIAGGALLVGGLTWYLLSDAPASTSRGGVRFQVNPMARGVVLLGAF